MLINRLISPKPILGYAFALFLLGANAECRAQFRTDSIKQFHRISLDSAIKLLDENYKPVGVAKQKVDNSIQRAEADVRLLAWEPATFMLGPWMAPYNPAEGRRMNQEGMIMLSALQMFPRKEEAELMKLERLSESYMAKGEYSMEVREARRELREAYSEVMFSEARLLLIDSQLMLRKALNRYTTGQFQSTSSLVSVLKAQKESVELESNKAIIQEKFNRQRSRLRPLIGSTDILVDSVREMIKESFYRFLPLNPSSPDSGINLLFSQLDFRSKTLPPKLFPIADDHRPNLNTEDLFLRAQATQNLAERKKLELESKPMWGVRFDHMQGLGMMPNLFTAGVMMQLPIRGKRARLTDDAWLNDQKYFFSHYNPVWLDKANVATYGIVSEINAAQTEETLLSQKLIPLQRRIIQALENAQRANKATALDVLEAQMALFDYQMRLLDAQERRAMAAIQLLNIYEL